MALWQFQCYIIPKMNSKIELVEDELLSWKGKDIPLADFKFLEKTISWTEDIIQYGKEDGTCIQFLYEDGLLEEINCRLDLRSLSKKMLEEILNYVKKIEGMIFFENKVYPPDIENTVKLMKNSSANRFCKNPEKYFEELSNC